MKNLNKGVTVLEALVVVAILAILLAFVLPSFKTTRDRELLKSVSSDVVSSLDKARSQTLSSLNSSEYGVHFETDKLVIFKGTTYSSLDVNNEIISIVSPASISSINLTDSAVDVYFNRLSGAPNKTGTITVSVSGISKNITISATGTTSMD
jgi:type IV fimbrial biogenesis protein FimT